MQRRIFRAYSILLLITIWLCIAGIGCAGFSPSDHTSSSPMSGISGSISPAAAGEEVTVTLSGPTNSVTTTDSAGNYSFSKLPPGPYVISVSKTNFSFSPARQTVTLDRTGWKRINFNGNQTTASISGTINPAASGSGAKVTVIGATGASATADAFGNYHFGRLPLGSYTISVSKPNLTFIPASQTVNLSTAGLTQVNFGASDLTASISGNISPAASGNGAMVTLTGASSAITTADAFGNYGFSGLPLGSYTVSVNKTNFTFSPASQSVSLNSGGAKQVNFTAGSITVSISGTISPAPHGSGTILALTGAVNASATANSKGNYSFSGLPSGSYTLTPSKADFTFSPAIRQVTVGTSGISGISFTASAASQPSGPIVINGQNGTVVDGLTIMSTSGDCVTIINSTSITIRNSQIGPCAGNGIKITGGSGISVLDSYVHPETLAHLCCDHNDGILAAGGTQDLRIQGNVIAYGESNIEVQDGHIVRVIGNFLLNPRGPFPRGQNFQCWNNCTNVTVQNNYALSSTDTTIYLYPESTEDSISFGVSSGFVVQNNFVAGGHSPSGCGIMADTNSNGGEIVSNLLLNTGQCGIGIVDGSHIAAGNKVYNVTPVHGGGNTAIYVAHYGHSNSCGPISVTNNIADEIQQDGRHSGWWNRKDCGSIDTSTDSFGESTTASSVDGLLTPTSVVFAPPLIPPQPDTCVATSPYSTQKNWLPCNP